MWVLALPAAGVSFAISLLVSLVIRRWARCVGFVDRPHGAYESDRSGAAEGVGRPGVSSDHKRHGRPVALGGGIAVMVAVVAVTVGGSIVAWLVRDDGAPGWLPDLAATHLDGIVSKVPTLLALVGAAAGLHILGLIDDRRPLGPSVKLAAQILVAVVTTCVLGVRVMEFLPAPLCVGLSIAWIVLITNAFNFLDNMDGLSGGVAAIAAAVFAVAAMRAGQVFVPTLSWVVCGAVLGFLVLNVRPASLFMGDSGSLPIGYLMAVVPMLTTFYDPAQHASPFGVLVPLLVLAVPLYDVLSVVVHRLRVGESPFRGDQRHFSHRLVKRGMTQRRAVLTIYLATAATGLPAIVLPGLGWFSASLILIQCVCVVVMIAVLEHAGPRADGIV
ncbi:MAG: MraY family glycosyltransferase [Phycisphaerae bacterium]